MIDRQGITQILHSVVPAAGHKQSLPSFLSEDKRSGQGGQGGGGGGRAHKSKDRWLTADNPWGCQILFLSENTWLVKEIVVITRTFVCSLFDAL